MELIELKQNSFLAIDLNLFVMCYYTKIERGYSFFKMVTPISKGGMTMQVHFDINKQITFMAEKKPDSYWEGAGGMICGGMVLDRPSTD